MNTMRMKKYLSASLLASSLLASAAVTAEQFPIEGIITSATGALAALVPEGTTFSGDIDYGEGLDDAQVLLGGFCFTADGSGLPPTSPTCGSRSAVPLLPTGVSEYVGDLPPPSATFQHPGTDFNVATGGTVEIIAYSPTFGINIDITMVFNPDGTGSLVAQTESLGMETGDLTWEPVIVPVPAAAWLFASALLAVSGVKRRRCR